MSAVDRWLAERAEGVPDVLARHLDVEEDGDDVADALVRRGLRALGEALARPGRDRGAAFRLLAADAYLTYACQAAAEGDDPEGALREILTRIGDADGSGEPRT